MNIPVCYGCPLRSVPVESDNPFRRKRCEISAAKSKAVRGVGLTAIDFKCTTKTALFQPGQYVRFELQTLNAEGYDITLERFGWVLRWKGRKVQVISEQTDVPVIKLYPNRLTRLPSGDRRACVHCCKPEGVNVKVKTAADPEPRPWVCRFEYGEDGEQIHMACQYPEVSRG